MEREPHIATNERRRGAIVDSADPHSAASALQLSDERLLRLFVEHVPTPCAMFDTEMRYLLASRRWMTDYHVSDRNIIGLSHYEVFPDCPQHWKEVHRRCLAGATECCDEDRYERSDGTVQWVRWEVRPWQQANGGIGGIIIFSEEITGHKRSETELRQRDRRFRDLADAIPQIVWTASPDGALTYLNAKIAEYTGVEVGELTGWSWQKVIHPDDLPPMRAKWIETIRSGIPRTIEFRMRRADGQYRWQMGRQVPVRDPTGAIETWYGTVTDIEDLKLAAAALSRSGQRLAESQQLARLGSWEFDPRTGQFWWSAELYQLFGIDPATVQPGFEAFISLVHPDDRPAAIARSDAMKAGALEVSGDVRVIRPDGQCVWLHSRARVTRDESGKATLVEGTEQDITDRKRAEEERDRLWDHAPDPMCIAGFDGELKQLNPAWTRRLGWSEQELRGRPLTDLLHPDDYAATLQLEERMHTGETITGFENRYRCKDGSYRCFSWSIIPMPAAQMICGLGRDVTEEKQLAEQFRQSQKMEAVGRLAGGVAHDFNNLLTVINGSSKLLLKNLADDDPRKSLLSGICDAGERAAGLTSQLLAFSRKAIVEPKILDLNRIVENTARLLRRLIGEDISLIVVQQPSLPSIKADSGQLEQVIMNLAINARDAMPRGGRLLIETRSITLANDDILAYPDLRSGRYVCLDVCDTGEGMTENVKNQIFEPFFTTKEVGKGTGLGLAVVHGVMKQCCGHVGVESAVGVGTKFRLLFPADGDAAILPVAQKAGATCKVTETILLVEDERLVRNLICAVLTGEGYTVLEAASAQEAIELVANYSDRIDLLITDVVMPGMDGYHLAASMSAKRPDLPVLYISGYMNDGIPAEGRGRTAQQFLQKPFTPTDLTQKLRTILDRID